MNFTNSTQGITRVPYSRMLKSEMADYAEKTINIVGSHDPESALINQVYNLLQDQKPQIELLRLSYGVDTERLRVDSLKAELMLTVSALKLKVRMLSRSNLTLELHTMENAINSHLRYLDKCKNDKELIQKVTGFLDLLDINEAVFTAFSEFDLLHETDSIKMALAEVNAASEKRVKLLSKRSKVSTRVVMKTMHNAINNLFKAIEVSHLAGYPSNSEEGGSGAVASDFTDLINELSQLSEMYNRSISIRIANNQRKAEKEKEHEEGNSPEPIATGMLLRNISSANEPIITPYKPTDHPMGENGANELHDDVEATEASDEEDAIALD